MVLLPGLLEPAETRLFTTRPFAGSGVPEELGTGVTPMIFPAAGSMKLEGILLLALYVMTAAVFFLDPVTTSA